MYVTLRQPGTGKAVSLKAGNNWFFLLSPIYGIPQFIKGLWGHGLLMILLGLLAMATTGSGASPIVGLLIVGAWFFYVTQGNKLVARNLLIKGWKAEGDEASLAFARAKWRLAL